MTFSSFIAGPPAHAAAATDTSADERAGDTASTRQSRASSSTPSTVGALSAVTVTGQSDGGPYGTVKGVVARDSLGATKTKTSLLETPQSVSVVTREQMDQQNAQTLNAAVRYEAGVTPETRGGIATRYDLLTVRGFSADTYWNGLKLLTNNYYGTPQIDPYLMERIEVLRGPVSVLYGQASAGGILNQESRLPTVEPQHEIGIEFGNYGHKQAKFDFSGPIGDDPRYLYRVTGIARTEDGQVATTRNERLAIAPSFTWRPDRDTTLTLLALYQRDPRSTSYGAVPPYGTVLNNPFGKLPGNFYDGDVNFEKFQRTQTSLGWQFEKRLTPTWTVRSNARWLHLGQEYESVYDSGLEADMRTLDRGTAESNDTMNTYSIDNSIEGNFATGPLDHTLLAGFDYQHVGSGYNVGFGTAPSLDLFAPDNAQAITPPDLAMTRIRASQYGVYLQDQMHFGKVLLTLGGREDWATTHTTAEAFGTTSNQSDRAFTGRAGLTYVFDSGIAPYVSVTQSFVPQAGTDASGKPFDPERAHQYEVGVKYQPKNTSALFTAALFDLTRNNLLTTDANNPNYQAQSGQARSRGVELSAKVSPTRALDVTAAYAYTNTRYTRDNTGLQGKFLPAVPENQASVWANYRFDGMPLAGLSIGAGGRYTGTTYSTDNSFKVRSFFLADATMRYDLGRAWPKLKGSDIYVNAQNLFNRRYVASCYYGEWCAFGYGRQVFAGVDYRW
ncbi:TonB-dependent siderophore receptor [Robbsia sp. Bb-Pol-6]|uniref:TonB-dependent siderophore receptor n=1 Tax=Robbsia betulipollinis TaxID=2981849 RepID=A0ABT3ZHK7_9BURK|nr:TonB-dependent siderophore receptor [Robbsia betulipollinis]MCY0386006.1 TonB-dependent siderophore receptor [Robbsia betulipollinis]